MNPIEVDGVRLEVREIGASTPGSARCPLVFLHEGLGSVSLWTQKGLDWPAEVCAATGRAGVVYSRRGYGQSDAALEACSPRYMHLEAWDVLPALLRKLQIDRPVLLGHSDGATIALLHASRHPVSGCIAMAPHVLVETVSIQSISKARDAFEATDLRERLARHHADPEGAFRRWNDIWLSPAFRSFDIRADCRRVSAPLLVIQGEDDEYGTMRQLDEIALAAPHAQQLRLARCGHSPHRDQPAATLQAVVDFLDPMD
jgi:pimeloyl-ACP methyl ester carboxylesterase